MDNFATRGRIPRREGREMFMNKSVLKGQCGWFLSLYLSFKACTTQMTSVTSCCRLHFRTGEDFHILRIKWWFAWSWKQKHPHPTKQFQLKMRYFRNFQHAFKMAYCACYKDKNDTRCPAASGWHCDVKQGKRMPTAQYRQTWSMKMRWCKS